jgi:hypothetical protein
MDFTRKKYRQLVSQLKDCGYEFITYQQYCNGNVPEKYVILRHDVDLKPKNSLAVAHDEAEIGAKATYYFRAVPESWDDEIILEINKLGHEVGYHYEPLTTCNGDVQKAYEDFKTNLERLRTLVPCSTICMHGSPRSPFDSKDIWKQYDYKALGIIGEPYLDTDFSKMLYLTDTGRRWDGYKVSVRDKIEGYQEQWDAKGWSFHSTDDIIQALRQKQLPDHLMMTTHPQRWNANFVAWCSELLMQNLKNCVKRLLIKNHK